MDHLTPSSVSRANVRRTTRYLRLPNDAPRQASIRGALRYLARTLWGALGALAITTSSSWASADGEPVRRYRTDAEDLAWMQSAHPPAAQQFLEGESLLAKATSRDDIEKAAKLFEAAGKEAPQSALAYRRLCQTFTALERRDQAVEACRMAVSNRSGGLDFRATVGAIMSGSSAPTLSEIGYASAYTRRVRELMPDEPWAYAAQCDIAERLGDTEMFNQCLDDLRRVSPTHYETLRAESVAAKFKPGVGMILGWILLGVITLGTLAHALIFGTTKKWLRSKASTAVLAFAFFSSLGLFSKRADADTETAPKAVPSQPSRAGALSKHPIDPSDPVGSVPSPEQRDHDPLEYGYFLMDLSDKALAAAKKGDHAAAATYYRAMAKAVPDMAVSYSHMCDEYEAAGDLPKATEACAAALAKTGVKLEDYSHYGRIAFAKKEPFTEVEIADLDAVIDHLVKADSGREIGLEIQCNLGVRLGDIARLETCAPALAAIAPGHAKVTFFQWALALHKKDFVNAERLVAVAKTTTADPVQVQRMEKATFEALPVWRKGFRDWRVGGATAILVFAGLAMWIVRRAPPSTIEST